MSIKPMEIWLSINNFGKLGILTSPAILFTHLVQPVIILERVHIKTVVIYM